MEMERGEMGMNEKGFTLLEVLFSLTIFTVCSLSIAGMLIVGKKAIANGNNSFTAVQAAKAQMELLRSSSITDSASDTCANMSVSSVRCEWSVRKGLPEQGLSTIDVTSSWNEGDRIRQIVLTTLRFNRDE